MSSGERFTMKKSYLFWSFIFAVLIIIIYKIRDILLPFYVAIFISILFTGLVDKCEKKLRIPRAFTSAVITVLFCSFVVACIYALFNISFTKATKSMVTIRQNTDLVNDATFFIGEILKKFDIENTFNLMVGQFSDVAVSYISSIISYIVSNIFDYSADFIATIFLCVLSPIVMFLMLKDTPSIGKMFYALLPRGVQKETKQLINDIHESVFRYLEGQTIAAIILSICYALLLWPIGVEHFILLGVVIGFSSFVPYIGFYSATMITLFAVYNQFVDLKRTLLTLFLLIAMQVVDSGFITPKVVGSKLGVHPLFVIFGVLAAVPLFGCIGVFLALPLIGIFGVVLKFLIKKYKVSSYYNG